MRQVLPFLRHLVGPGRPANFLIRNKWRSLEAMERLRGMPLLLMSSLQVGAAALVRTHVPVCVLPCAPAPSSCHGDARPPCLLAFGCLAPQFREDCRC